MNFRQSELKMDYIRLKGREDAHIRFLASKFNIPYRYYFIRRSKFTSTLRRVKCFSRSALINAISEHLKKPRLTKDKYLKCIDRLKDYEKIPVEKTKEAKIKKDKNVYQA